jgi:hypothetical protein
VRIRSKVVLDREFREKSVLEKWGSGLDFKTGLELFEKNISKTPSHYDFSLK